MDEQRQRGARIGERPARRSAAVHKFGLGQALVFIPGEEFMIRIPALCTVTRLLPREGGEFQYYVRTEVDGQQRRAWESQLEDAGRPRAERGGATPVA